MTCNLWKCLFEIISQRSLYSFYNFHNLWNSEQKSHQLLCFFHILFYSPNFCNYKQMRRTWREGLFKNKLTTVFLFFVQLYSTSLFSNTQLFEVQRTEMCKYNIPTGCCVPFLISAYFCISKQIKWHVAHGNVDSKIESQRSLYSFSNFQKRWMFENTPNSRCVLVQDTFYLLNFGN